MGLPKAVTSVAVKRVGGAAFRVGFAEMNGWRPSVEDAHVIHAKDSWGFFGIFDGHGGDQCSRFMARRFDEELDKTGLPESDEAVTELVGNLALHYGTFVMVQAPSTPGGFLAALRFRATAAPQHACDVGGLETGDATRTISLISGAKEPGLSALAMGVARVSGLAVSRAFGNAQHKNVGGRSPQEQPVSCAPELQAFTCEAADFLVLCCDGISQGSFPNEAVVKLAAEKLKSAKGGPVDPAQAAVAVCKEALKCNSTDNLSCMIVLLGGGEVPGEPAEFIPGLF
ncbi:unnamed protein product [Symbiodinium pilosum]|uniref:protein-serine/threonine phosphatase n=1 Tax=Symbiodinium pilosum TaxID=2952 RepID=A0A812Y2P6_SYMPI|nr:unnamed protein product [Symbiodinium pilosum]